MYNYISLIAFSLVTTIVVYYNLEIRKLNKKNDLLHTVIDKKINELTECNNSYNNLLNYSSQSHNIILNENKKIEVSLKDFNKSIIEEDGEFVKGSF